MDRSEILKMMAALQLSGMRAAYDEIVATGIKRKHSVDQIIAALLKAEIAEKQARSIRYQMGVAKEPLNSRVGAGRQWRPGLLFRWDWPVGGSIAGRRSPLLHAADASRPRTR